MGHQGQGNIGDYGHWIAMSVATRSYPVLAVKRDVDFLTRESLEKFAVSYSFLGKNRARRAQFQAGLG